MSTLIRTCALAGVLAWLLGAGAAKAEPIFSCIPINVIEIVGSRIHVECSNSITFGDDVITWVAVPIGDPNLASRFVTFANAALINGKRFIAVIPESSATNVPGCSLPNCRTPVQFGIAN